MAQVFEQVVHLSEGFWFDPLPLQSARQSFLGPKVLCYQCVSV